MWLPIFFSPSDASQAAGHRFLERIRARTDDRDVPVSQSTVAAHAAAARRSLGGAARGDFAYLKRIAQPTLVVNGSNDIVVPTGNSYILQQNLPDAELIPFPDSNPGSHFQFTHLFNRYATEFLDRQTMFDDIPCASPVSRAQRPVTAPAPSGPVDGPNRRRNLQRKGDT